MSRAISDAYAELSPAARLVAQVCGVAFPSWLRQAHAVRLLRQAEVRLLGRYLNAEQVRRGKDELLEARVLKADSPGYRVDPAWALPMTRAAYEEGRLEPLLRAYLADPPSGTWYEPLSDEPLLRGYLVAGRFDKLDALVEEIEAADAPLDWAFLAEPLQTDLLRTLPQRHQSAALASCLRHAVDAAAPADALLALCKEQPTQLGPLLDQMAMLHVCRGDFAAAHDLFSSLPPSVAGSKEALVALAACQSLVATLRGQDQRAWEHIDAALAAERAGTRKRIVYPASRTLSLALLALVRLDTPQSRGFLENTLNAAERTGNGPDLELTLVETATQAKSESGVFSHRGHASGIDVLFDAYVCCWLEDFEPGAAERRDRLLAFGTRAAANGYRWLAAECAEALRRYRALHKDAGPEPNAVDHAELGTTTLADLARPAAEWEYSLKALEQLAFNASEAKPKAEARPERLAWTVRRSSYWDLEGRLQRQNKSGSWSKGRMVAARRLVAEAGAMAFLTEQDRAVIAAASTERNWNGERTYFGAASLYALAGHPRVFDEEGQPIDVVRRDPVLSIDDADDGSLSVRLEPHPGPYNARYLAVLANPSRYEVTRLTKDHQRLADAVPEEGLTLPAGAKARLLEAVAALAANVRVQSASAGGVAGAREVAADPLPWVLLEPLEGGLSVAVVVEPIPDSGICFEPGAGGATVFASCDGESVQTQRDLDAERTAGRRLAASCPQLSPLPTDLEPLTLADPPACLELVEALQAAEARCKWPKGEPFRVVAAPGASSLSLTVRSAAEWLQASGKLAIDEQRVLDLKRLFELLEANPGSRFLELGDGEFISLTSTFRRQLEDFASLAAPAAQGAMRLSPLAAVALDDLLDDVELDADAAWQDLRTRLAEAEAVAAPVPSTLQAELRPYQVEGYQWLARLASWGAGACLADDMGLGKTVQALAVLLARAPEGPALVVAPTSVVANWTDEAHRFAPTLRVCVYAGAAGARTELLSEAGPFDLYVTTYGVLQNDIEALAAVSWHSAVLDEAQAIKNPAAKRTRAARQLPANFRMVTTGTPIQNNLMDLHSLFTFVNPGLLGSQQQFRSRFGVPVERDGDAAAHARLRRLVAPFLLRRLKADVLDSLPPRTEITLHVTMSEEEAALYEAMRQRAIEALEAAHSEAPELGEGARRVQVLAQLTRLRLACCNARLVLEDDAAPPSAKLATFATTLAELLENRHKVLVFSQFVRHLKLVEEQLQKMNVSYQYLDGATPAKARRERIAAFQAGEGDVFLISLRAGGVGLNLTAADYVIHMDPWWNPAVEDQASDRAHRIGQTRPVTIYRLVTEGTIEEQIVDLHHRKRDLATQLLQDADAPAKLDAEALLELLREQAS